MAVVVAVVVGPRGTGAVETCSTKLCSKKLCLWLFLHPGSWGSIRFKVNIRLFFSVRYPIGGHLLETRTRGGSLTMLMASRIIPVLRFCVLGLFRSQSWYPWVNDDKLMQLGTTVRSMKSVIVDKTSQTNRDVMESCLYLQLTTFKSDIVHFENDVIHRFIRPMASKQKKKLMK